MSKKQLVLSILLILSAILSSAQSIPDWMDPDLRAIEYPSSRFFIGLSNSDINPNDNLEKVTERIRSAAQTNLLESIRVTMKSQTASTIISESVNNQYYEKESFDNVTTKDISAEIAGMETDSYYDHNSKMVYAFAHVSKNKVVAYHSNLLSNNITQMDILLNTAQDLLSKNDREAARQQCDLATETLGKIKESQCLLESIKSGEEIEESVLQRERVNNMSTRLVLLQSDLDPKHDLVLYLQKRLDQKLIHARSYLNTSQSLLDEGEKAKARQQCEKANQELLAIRQIQDSIQKTDISIPSILLKQDETEALYNEVTTLSTQLAQAVTVYVESNEELFGKSVSIIADILKSKLAQNGCSFTEEKRADYKILITAETRESSSTGSLVFCYADVSMELIDITKQRSLFNDSLSVKGGSSSKEKAARKAMENAADQIMKSISNVIN